MKVKASIPLFLFVLALSPKVLAQEVKKTSDDSLKSKETLAIPPPPPMVADTGKKVYEMTYTNGYSYKEEMPQFPGGMAELVRYITTNIQYPTHAKKNGIQGKVVARFLVTTEGNIEQINIIKSVDAELDNEVIRMIKSMPRWEPGKQISTIEGKTTIKNIKTYYTLPVSFKR